MKKKKKGGFSESRKRSGEKELANNDQPTMRVIIRPTKRLRAS